MEAPGWKTGALGGRFEVVVCVMGTEVELESVFPARGEVWIGGDVVFKSAMTRCNEDRASLDSVGETEFPGLFDD
jgi:hypothetical protein